jgi:PAS domain S-box-containing protein
VLRPLRVLIVEDSPADAELMALELRHAGFAPEWECVETEEGFLDSLQRDFDIILSDYSMPQFDGMRALELAKRRGLEIPFILVSGAMGEETAVAAMKQGATDYLLKDRLARLGPAVTQALEQSRLRKERTRSEEALRESEERFRQLAENIHEVFWLTDPAKNVILYVSPAYETIWGRSRAGVVYASASSWLDSVHPEDKEAVRNAAASKQAEGTYDEEYRIVRPDGSIRWIHDRAFQVRNGAGEIYRVVGVASDVTERKLSEEATRVSVQRFELFMDNLPGYAWIKDQERRYVYANKPCRQFALAGREWFGKTDDELWPPEIAAIYRANDQQVIETKAPRETVETILYGGEERAAMSSKFPILNDAGDVAYVCGIGIDITERRRGEERLREQADIINLAPDAIVVRDLQDQIQFWNQGAERLYGWTALEVAGRKVTEILYDELDPFYAANAALEKKGKWSGELQHRCKDGSNVTVDARWTLVRDDKGEPKSVLSINTDITERKDLEARFLRAQRMESIGTLASGVAHDLNNILAPILMGAAVLRRTEMPGEDEAILSTIETCAQRGADIVKQVLTFARGAEGARLLLQPAHLINDMAKIAEETFPKTITVRTGFSQSLWPIEGDPTQLHQVLLNLSVNARDAMPRGGTLTLSAENFPVDEHYASMTPGAKAGPHVLFEVIDTGLGISRDVIDKIFDPFFTTKKLGHGTGLGLSTLIGIVKSHGGFASVYSEIGRGTTFKVYLPARTGALETLKESEAPALPPLANGELLLIVDDEKPILQVAKALLEGHGYRVLTAGDATEALAIFALRKNEIKLVLTDLAMPLMDGIVLIRTLQKMKPKVRIIASTGRGGREQHDDELAGLNVRACLTKPYNKDKLLTTLHDALNPQTDEQ